MTVRAWMIVRNATIGLGATIRLRAITVRASQTGHGATRGDVTKTGRGVMTDLATRVGHGVTIGRPTRVVRAATSPRGAAATGPAATTRRVTTIGRGTTIGPAARPPAIATVPAATIVRRQAIARRRAIVRGPTARDGRFPRGRTRHDRTQAVPSNTVRRGGHRCPSRIVTAWSAKGTN